jgi:hypothetical protein
VGRAILLFDDCPGGNGGECYPLPCSVIRPVKTGFDTMATKKEINEILDALNNGKFHVECPSCEEEVKLSDAGLFHLDNFTPESRDIYKSMVEEQKERRADL